MGACGPSLLLEPLLSSAVIATGCCAHSSAPSRRPSCCAPWRAASDRRARAFRARRAFRQPVGRHPRAPRRRGLSARRPQGGGDARRVGGYAAGLGAQRAATAAMPEGVSLFLVPRAMPGLAAGRVPQCRRPARRGCVSRGGVPSGRRAGSAPKAARWRRSRRRSTSASRRCARKRWASCRRSSTPPSSTCARGNNSASPSADSRRCSTASPTWWFIWSRRAR